MKQYLLLGCGNNTEKRLSIDTPDGYPSSPEDEWDGDVTTVDYNPAVNPDILTDLNILPYDWTDKVYDEIHAYDVLEHCGSQGDGDFFFDQFNEFHRMLKPDGLMLLSVPIWNNICAYGVPDHKRIMPSSLFGFLEEKYYDNLGKPGFGDYRHFIKGYWEVLIAQSRGELLSVVLRRI